MFVPRPEGGFTQLLAWSRRILLTKPSAEGRAGLSAQTDMACCAQPDDAELVAVEAFNVNLQPEGRKDRFDRDMINHSYQMLRA